MISPTTGGENTTHLMTKQVATTSLLASESERLLEVALLTKNHK